MPPDSMIRRWRADPIAFIEDVIINLKPKRRSCCTRRSDHF